MKTKFITDNKGKKVEVIISIEDYQKIIEQLEDVNDVRAYDKAKASKEVSVPIDEAFKMIEKKRKARR
jgi:hypothetical protein